MQNRTGQRGILMICWENLLPLIAVNLLFVVCCIPVVTAPAAMVALSRVSQKCLNEERGFIQSYLQNFRRALLRAMPAGFLLTAGACVIGYCAWFYIANGMGSIVGMACAMFCIIALYLLYCVAMCAFQLQASTGSFGIGTVLDAVHLILREPKLLYTWLAVSFCVVALTAWFFPRTFPFAVLLTFSLSNILAARGVLSSVGGHRKE